MRRTIEESEAVHFPIFKAGVLGLLLVAGGPRVPELDIKHTCQDIAGQGGLQTCVAEESYARRKLIKYWQRIPSASKRQCLLDPLPPDPSYIFLRDCINNDMMVRKSSR